MKMFTKYLVVLTLESVAMTVLTKYVQRRFEQVEADQSYLFDLANRLDVRINDIEDELDDDEKWFDDQDEEIVVAQGLGYPVGLGYETRPEPSWLSPEPEPETDEEIEAAEAERARLRDPMAY